MKTKMKPTLILISKIVLGVIGVGTLTFMLWEPHLEGRNAGATLSQIYFNDPFLWCVYLASTPFFVALYQAFKLLVYAGKNSVYGEAALKPLQMIKYCARALIIFALIGIIFIMLGDGEEKPPGVFMSLLVIVGAGAIEIVARKFERALQNKLNTV